MKAEKKLAKWLKDEVEFLKANQDYVGGWITLNGGPFAVVVCWSEGWGKESRNDCIQAKENPDFALVSGIKIVNHDDTPDMWIMPFDKETGDVVCEESGISPTEKYEDLAKFLLAEYKDIKDVPLGDDGSLDFAAPNDSLELDDEAEKEPELEPEEETVPEPEESEVETEKSEEEK